MKSPVVHSLAPIALIGGGNVGPDDLSLALKIAPTCVAADGGANVAVAAGIIPAAVIGDFDSVTSDTLSKIPVDRHHHIVEQNSTDFDKCLRNISAPVVIAVGFSGARIDHQMGALHTLVVRSERPCIILGPEEIVFHCPPHITIPTLEGETVSLFPMSEITGKSTGLEWPIDGLVFSPNRQIGTLNRAYGEVTLAMSGPGMLCIVPRRLIGAITQVLASLPVHETWPVPEE
ncbi:MAG: thiamine diphosphokinase [Hyphomicrobiales bacterium]